MTTQTTAPATDRQVAYLTDLARMNPGYTQTGLAGATEALTPEVQRFIARQTKESASDAIGTMLAFLKEQGLYRPRTRNGQGRTNSRPRTRRGCCCGISGHTPDRCPRHWMTCSYDCCG